MVINSKTPIIPGKWYVIDTCASPGRADIVSGPFDSKEEADKDNQGSNIEEDCISMQLKAPGTKHIPVDPNPCVDTSCLNR